MPVLNTLFGLGAIFMLHRVYPAEAGRLPANEHMKIAPDALEAFILEARARGHAFVSLDQMHEALVSGASTSRLIAMTLDDGYADNYTHAWPLFRRHQVPFTLYVTTAFPERTALLWWYLLEDAVLEQDVLTLADGSRHSCSSPEQRMASFMRLRERIIATPQAQRETVLRDILGARFDAWPATVERLALSWEQITEMSRDPLVTIGAHTISHPALNTLAETHLLAEVAEGRQRIESHIGKPVRHFCYPFGSEAEVGEREIELVSGLGFLTATTTRHGLIYPGHRTRLCALPRIMLGPDFSWPRFRRHALKISLLRRGRLP